VGAAVVGVYVGIFVGGKVGKWVGSRVGKRVGVDVTSWPFTHTQSMACGTWQKDGIVTVQLDGFLMSALEQDSTILQSWQLAFVPFGTNAQKSLFTTPALRSDT